jgi:hypothetical protein
MQRMMMAFVAVAALAACNGGQPRIYRVAVDQTPARNVQTAACWKMQAVPTSFINETNLLVEEQWVIWDGLDSQGAPKYFLDFGRQNFNLGDAPEIDFNELISSGVQGQFSGQRVRSQQVPGIYTEVRQTSITVTFNDLGAAPTGTMSLKAAYACQGTCPPENQVNDPRSCEVPLQFSARRIDVSRIAGYSEQGDGN